MNIWEARWARCSPNYNNVRVLHHVLEPRLLGTEFTPTSCVFLCFLMGIAHLGTILELFKS